MVAQANDRATSATAWIAVAGIVLLTGAGFVLAADTGLSQDDREFVNNAAQGGIMEVTAGRLAVSRAEDPSVRTFGQRMVTDHTAANQMLKSVADAKQLPLPESSGAEEQSDLSKLEALNGAKFDRRYAAMMVKDHEKDIREFEKEARHGHDRDIKAFAQQTLPTLRHHLEMAKQLASQMKIQ